MRFLLAAIALSTTTSALALSTPPSRCAWLPEASVRIVQGPPTYGPKINGLCPPNTTPDANGCAGPGLPQTVNTTPLADCYHALALGPLDGLTASRPTLQCATRALLVANVRLRGTNVGYGDIALTVHGAHDIGMEVLDRSGPTVTPADDPLQNNCLAPNCRFVRITTVKTSPSTFQIDAKVPNGGKSAAATVSTDPALCPAPPGKPVRSCQRSSGTCP